MERCFRQSYAKQTTKWNDGIEVTIGFNYRSEISVIHKCGSMQYDYCLVFADCQAAGDMPCAAANARQKYWTDKKPDLSATSVTDMPFPSR